MFIRGRRISFVSVNITTCRFSDSFVFRSSLLFLDAFAALYQKDRRPMVRRERGRIGIHSCRVGRLSLGQVPRA